MVLFEEFKLAELKDIFLYIKNKYGLLNKYKIYKLNKYDLIILLRNCGYFDEDNGSHLYFRYRDEELLFLPLPSNRYYKGEKKQQMEIFRIPITIHFQ